MVRVQGASVGSGVVSSRALYVDMACRPGTSPFGGLSCLPPANLSFDIQSRRLTANPVASAFLAVMLDPPDRLLSIWTNETLRGGG